MAKDIKGFTSVSISKLDAMDYDSIRGEYAKSIGIPENKISLATVIRIAMSEFSKKLGDKNDSHQNEE